jgi:hypothetical protein
VHLPASPRAVDRSLRRFVVPRAPTAGGCLRTLRAGLIDIATAARAASAPARMRAV